MKKTVVSALILAAILTACSKQEDEKSLPVKPTPAATPVSNPPATSAARVETPAQTTVSKDYAFKGAGVLRLTFPKTWANISKRIMEGKEPVNVVQFAPFNGNDFEVIVEVRILGEAVTKSFDVHASLLQMGQLELANCVEQSLDIHDLEGPEVVGGYYTVTDKRYVNAPPAAGEYKYLTQGYAKLAGVLLKFRVVSNQPPGEEKKAALEMIQTARFTRR